MDKEFTLSGWENITFYQLKKGYRFSIDTVLLAAFVKFKKNARILEAGSGEGVIPLFLQKRGIDFSYTGVEIQPLLVQLSRKNLIHGKIKGEIIHGDYRELKIVEQESYNVGVVNPPYYSKGAGKRNPDPVEEIARHEISGSLKEALKFLSWGVKKKGKIYIIYNAKRLQSMISTMTELKIAPKKILPVYSHKNGEAIFILCEGIREGGEEAHILPPLIIYKNTRKKEYTEETKKIFDTLTYP